MTASHLFCYDFTDMHVYSSDALVKHSRRILKGKEENHIGTIFTITITHEQLNPKLNSGALWPLLLPTELWRWSPQSIGFGKNPE